MGSAMELCLQIFPFLFFSFETESFTNSPKVVLNSYSSCLVSLGAGIAGLAKNLSKILP